jgi:RNA polymerase sigma-70 factor, ECF subfamily
MGRESPLARAMSSIEIAEAAEQDEASALDRLVPLLYDELRAMARRQLAREHGHVTLQTTALVHEAYLKLVDQSQVTRRGRAYFFGAAARAMRQILVDRARRRVALKRGGGDRRIPLQDVHVSMEGFAADLIDLDDALKRLRERGPRQARVVEFRFFGGMSVEECADALGVSPRTVESDWAMARAWLFDALGGRSEPPSQAER